MNKFADLKIDDIVYIKTGEKCFKCHIHSIHETENYKKFKMTDQYQVDHIIIIPNRYLDCDIYYFFGVIAATLLKDLFNAYVFEVSEDISIC